MTQLIKNAEEEQYSVYCKVSCRSDVDNAAGPMPSILRASILRDGWPHLLLPRGQVIWNKRLFHFEK
jgi:hypothetical protein